MTSNIDQCEVPHPSADIPSASHSDIKNTDKHDWADEFVSEDIEESDTFSSVKNGLDCGKQENYPPPKEIPYGQFEEDRLRLNFDILDTTHTGVLNVGGVSALFAKYKENVDARMATKLIKCFTGGCNIIGFTDLLAVFRFYTLLKKTFLQNPNIQGNQAPNILLAVLSKEQQPFVGMAISNWLINYYILQQHYIGLVGVTQQEFGKYRDFDKPFDPQGGISFHDILEMAVNAVELAKGI